MTAQRSRGRVWSGRDCQAAGTQASAGLAGTPTERAACRGRAGSPRGRRPGPEVPRPRGAGREARVGGSRRPAGAPPRPLAQSTRPRASVRAASLPRSAGRRVQVHVPPLHSRPRRLALVPPRPGRPGRCRVPEAAAGGGLGGAGRIPSVRGWVCPGSAGSCWLPGPPRRASALLGAPAAWRRLGTGFGLPDLAASPGWPFQTSLKSCEHAVSSSFVKWA